MILRKTPLLSKPIVKFKEYRLTTILGQEVLKTSPKSNTTTLQTSELQKGECMVTTEIDGNFSASIIVKEQYLV